jgi:hypothetical protein
MPPILFAVEEGESRSLPLSAQRLVNYFVERQPPEAKSQSPLFGAPGTDLWTTTSVFPNRGAWIYGGQAYWVQGSELWLTDQFGVATMVGDGISGNGPVSMSDNGVQIIMVNGAVGEGYTYSTADGLQQITDPNFFPANTVTFMDGYFLFDRLGSNEWFLSNLYDGRTYNGLDFASAEAVPGSVTAIKVNLELVFIFCSAHIEIWYDAGTFPFPFQRYAGGVIDYGCISPHAIIKQDGAIFFLGVDKVVYRLQANVPIRISTHPIEHLIAQDPDITQATMATFTIEGHKMVVLHFPLSKQTVVFDISTGKWHLRESWNTTTGIINPTQLGMWRATNALEVYQDILLGDRFDGRIGKMNWSSFTEYGNVMQGLARSAPQHHDRKWLFVNDFELDIESGVGLNGDEFGSDPKIMLRYSRNGGRTWSQYQPFRSMGQIGEYQKRLRWWKQGRGLQWCWEVSCSDPVKRTIIAAHATIDVGM